MINTKGAGKKRKRIRGSRDVALAGATSGCCSSGCGWTDARELSADSRHPSPGMCPKEDEQADTLRCEEVNGARQDKTVRLVGSPLSVERCVCVVASNIGRTRGEPGIVETFTGGEGEWRISHERRPLPSRVFFSPSWPTENEKPSQQSCLGEGGRGGAVAGHRPPLLAQDLPSWA